MDSSKDQNAPLNEKQIIDLFKVAVREDDEAQLGAAIEALWDFPGRIDLTEADPQKGDTIGDRLAELVVNNILQWETEMLELVHQFHKIELKDHTRQRILAQLLAVSMVHHDDEALTELMKLVPSKVTNPILAYNLACNSARQMDHAAMLKYAKLALWLGKSPEQFRYDADFASYLNDKEFASLLETSRKPGDTAEASREALRAAILHSIDIGDWEQFNRLVQEVEQHDLILIPTQDHAILIFNLARTSARQKDRAALLKYTKQTLVYYTPPAQFRADPDFAPYLKDKEFAALLDIAKAAEQAVPIERDKLLDGLRSGIDSSDWQQFDQRVEEEKQRSLFLTTAREITEHAIRGGNVRIFMYVFESINKQQPGELPVDILLLQAAEHRRHEIARFLLKKGVGVVAELDERPEAMNTAIKNDDAEMVQLLIESGADFDNKKKINPREYFYAKLLGMDTTELDISRGFAQALSTDAVNVVQLILKRASIIHFIDRKKYKKTLKYYLNHGKLSVRMTTALFNGGFDFDDLRAYRNNETLLKNAITSNATELVDYLLNEKNAPLDKDMQEMHAAVERSDAGLFERLIRHQRKLDPHWTFANARFWNSLETFSDKSDSKRSELVKSLFGGNNIDSIKVFATLVISPEDKSARDALLAISIGSENIEAARYFLEQGADPNVQLRSESDKTYPAISVALSNCNLRMATLLLDRGADTRYVDSQGNTLLDDLASCSESPAKIALIARLTQSHTVDKK